MLRLKELILSLTNKCNSSCIICDIPKLKVDELSTEDWKKVIEDVCLLGASTVVFSGGEPLLRTDLTELVYFARSNNLKACITSNGLLMDSKMVHKLASAGINVVNISLEGPCDIHDKLRGKGSFKKALLALDNLRKYNIESTVATMVSSYNFKFLKYVVEVAREKNATTIKFQPFNTIFLSDKSRKPEFLISKKEAVELKQIMKEVDFLCSKYGISTDPYTYLERIPDYLSGKFSNHSDVCGALWESCPIDSSGNIYPCWILSGKNNLIGNVKEKILLELWDSDKHNEVREAIKDKGCPGCMMSCYDYVFGRDGAKKRIAINLGRLKKEGFIKYFSAIYSRWVKRFKFYRAYRGSLKGFISRLKNFFKKKILLKRNLSLNSAINKEEIHKALKEISIAEQILDKRISKGV